MSVCQPDWEKDSASLFLSVTSSHGLSDLTTPDQVMLSLNDALDMSMHSRVFRLPVTQLDSHTVRLVDAWSGSLGAMVLKISTGPVVPFRATEYLADYQEKTNLPLIWMNHVHAMSVQWPNKVKKPQYIRPRSSKCGVVIAKSELCIITSVQR